MNMSCQFFNQVESQAINCKHMRINLYVEHITELIDTYFKTWLAESESPSRALSPGFMHQNTSEWEQYVSSKESKGKGPFISYK